MKPRTLAALALIVTAACATLLVPGLTRAAQPEPAVTAAGPRSDDAEQVVATAIKAALANDFKTWLMTMHPTERATPQQQSQLERYTFKRVTRQAAWYVKGGDANSFQIERREDMGGGRVKLFLKDLEHPTRAAVPVALEKQADGAWGIIAISL